MRAILIMAYLIVICAANTLKNNEVTGRKSLNRTELEKKLPPIRCQCGIFMGNQVRKGSKEQPRGQPALLQELPISCPCNSAGNRICVNKCLDMILKHLSNSETIICGTLGRDCRKERAYLYVKNCKDEWINTNLSARREYCCKDGLPYKCPVH